VDADCDQVPVGAWAKGQKEIGVYHLAEIMDAVEPYTLALYTKVLGKSVEETRIGIEHVRRELSTKKNHLYVNYHFVTATKPNTSGSAKP